MQSPLLLFHSLFLGFGSHLVQQTPSHPSSKSWPHAEHPTRCQRCCLGRPCSTSLFHVPPLLPAQPRWSQEEDGYFGEAEFTPLGPTGPFITFCDVCVLRFVICLPPQAGFPCFSKLFSGRCWDVFPTWSKALPLPTHATKPGNSQNTQPNPSQRPGHPSTQHDAAIGRFFITRFHQSSRALRSM